MNSEYFIALAQTFERHYDVEFSGIRKGPVTDSRERLIQFKTNIDVVMSLLDRNGLGDWLVDRLVAIGDTVPGEIPVRIDVRHDPFLDERLRRRRRSAASKRRRSVDNQSHLRAIRRKLRFHAVSQTRGDRRHARRHFGNHQVDELRDRQPLPHAGGRSLRIHQRRARQPVGPLRSRRRIRSARASRRRFRKPATFRPRSDW